MKTNKRSNFAIITEAEKYNEHAHDVNGFLKFNGDMDWTRLSGIHFNWF